MDEEIKKFLLLRPIVEGVNVDNNNMPIIKNQNLEFIKDLKFKLTNFKNINSVIDRGNTIIDLFNYDDVLEALWRNPFKYIAVFDGFLAVASPDYSVYPEMSIKQIENNIFKSRWLGSLWQRYGIKVIPTVSWAKPDTYDICFSGLQKNNVVIISTLGVSKNVEMFIEGFNEMKRRIEPSLIIVVGKLFDEMYGEFLIFSLDETFSQRIKGKQVTLFEMYHYVKRDKGGLFYGW